MTTDISVLQKLIDESDNIVFLAAQVSRSKADWLIFAAKTVFIIKNTITLPKKC